MTGEWVIIHGKTFELSTSGNRACVAGLPKGFRISRVIGDSGWWVASYGGEIETYPDATPNEAWNTLMMLVEGEMDSCREKADCLQALLDTKL